MIISYANHLQKRLYGEDLNINSYLFKINNRYTRKICEICTKLIIRHQNEVTGVYLAFLWLALNIFTHFSSVSMVDFDHVFACWVHLNLLKWFPYRSSRPEVPCKKGVRKNFAKFTGKHLCRSLFFNKVTSLQSASFNFPKK